MIKNNIKLIALDLDGTLLSKFGTISDYAIKTLLSLRKNGILIVIASGRPYYSIQRIIPDECYDFAVCMNGQMIVNKTTDETFSERSLHPNEIKEMTRYMHRYPVVLACSIDNAFHHYCDKKYMWLHRIFSIAKTILDWLKHEPHYNNEIKTEYEDLPNQHVGKICYSGTTGVLKRIQKELITSGYACFMVSPFWLEVQPPNISKGIALKKIMIMKNIKETEAVAIGDGENDIPMFECVEHSVAMRNAMRSVKQSAKYHAGTFVNDGCAKWIDENILKKM